MFIIAGLGNVGKQYEGTRHNAGFIALDALADKLGIRMGKVAHKGTVGEGLLGGQKVLLLKPSTFMNLSGESLLSAVNYYKITPADSLIVVYDDIDLPPGGLRIRDHGGAGTHNGMRSILYQLQTEDFPRVRIGVGQPPAGYDLAAYVLGKPSKEDGEKITAAIKNAVDAICIIVEEGVSAAQQKYNHID